MTLDGALPLPYNRTEKVKITTAVTSPKQVCTRRMKFIARFVKVNKGERVKAEFRGLGVSGLGSLAVLGCRILSSSELVKKKYEPENE